VPDGASFHRVSAPGKTQPTTPVRIDHVGGSRELGDVGSEVWHDCGMARTRLSTTVNAELLAEARRVRAGVTNAVLIDTALEALLARHRAAEVDASYAAYDDHPLDEADEWGDLASFRQAAASS